MLRPIRTTLWLALVVLTTATSSNLSHANQYPRTSVDAVLLYSDALLFAEVRALETSADGIIRVTLTNINAVRSRWNLQDGFSFNVRGWFDGDGAVRPLSFQPKLKVGHRYLLLMVGGAWTRAPILTIADGIYAFDKDRRLECPGGFVYGLDLNGLRCMTPTDVLQPPPGEAELFEALRAADLNARTRRPLLATELDMRAELPNTAPDPEVR